MRSCALIKIEIGLCNSYRIKYKRSIILLRNLNKPHKLEQALAIRKTGSFH